MNKSNPGKKLSESLKAVNFHKKWRSSQASIRESIVGLKAAEEHLRALAIMARDDTLHEWNSHGTVKTIYELRNLIDKLEKENG